MPDNGSLRPPSNSRWLTGQTRANDEAMALAPTAFAEARPNGSQGASATALLDRTVVHVLPLAAKYVQVLDKEGNLVNVKKTLDYVSTGLVTAAAAFLLWGQVESRWLRPDPSAPRQVKGLAIKGSSVRHASGSGEIALVEFTDYECPFCGKYERETAPLVRKDFVDTGRIKHVVFNFPLDAVHPRARKAAEAAECAGRQGKYWQMHQRIFSDQKLLAEDDLLKSAVQLGLDREAFLKCLGGEASGDVTADQGEGLRLGVRATPTFFLGKVERDGSVKLISQLDGALPFEKFRAALDEVAPQRQAAK